MLKLSKKIEYALIAMLDLANRNKYDLVTTKFLANNYHIPQEILGKVLQSLSKKGLLESVQGVKGGYLLSGSIDEINIRDVIEAVEGPISLISCSTGNICDCEQIARCNIKTPMEIIQYELAEFFGEISLRDVKDRYKNIFPVKYYGVEGSTSTN
ncbi:MAG: Rrf2 family transcriptional regulator [Calditrichaceae bacterium]